MRDGKEICMEIEELLNDYKEVKNRNKAKKKMFFDNFFG